MELLKYLISPATFALLLGGLLTSVFGLFAAISKEERIPKWIIWGSFFAGSIVLVGGIYSGFEQEKMSESLQAKSEKISNLSQKIIDLEEKNVELSNTIADSVTGGDSYLEITPFIPVGSNMIQFYLHNCGKNPLYDVNIRILDQTMLQLLDYESVHKDKSLDPLLQIKSFNALVNKAAIYQNIGNISPNNIMTLGPLKITGADLDKKEQLYLISVTARNGSSSVNIKAIKVDTSWEYSWRGVDMSGKDNKKVLYEVIRDGVTLD
jgi:hypothetical protein